MSKRCFQDSFGNGPRKIDGDNIIIQCFDCSLCGRCPYQDGSRWPATTIAAGCPLLDAPESET